MIWRDLVVPRQCTNQQIAAALSASLEVEPTKITVSDSIESIGDQAVFCLRSDVSEGALGSVLSIYLDAAPLEDDSAVSAFARTLGWPVLTSDDESADPYSMRLFPPGEPPRVVEMLVTELDEGRYAIAEIAGLGTSDGVARPAPVRAPNSCPATGYWMTPARVGSRRHFTFGETMPDLDSDYGTTIWQWDERQ